MRYNPHGPDWHTLADLPADITLEEYAAAWRDMAPHVGQLTEYARSARTIVEFGLRGAVSTWALLDGLPEHGRLIGIDIDPAAPIPPRVRDDPRFRFVAGDAAKVTEAYAADLVMIDASHEFTATVLELVAAASMDPDRILLHDYLYRHTPHVRWAVDGYVADPYTPDHWHQVPYRLETVHESEWGLAVLVRR